MLRPSILFGTALLLSLPLAAQTQDNSAPTQQQSQPTSSDQQKKPDKQEKKKPASAANPFPEAQSEKAAQQDQPSNQEQKPDVPAAPEPSQRNQTAPGKKPSTAEANPFPEAQSESAARQEQRDGQSQQEAPGSGDQEYSSSQVHLKGMDLAPNADDTAPVQASSPLPYDPKLAKKDAQVGDFYLETGDFKGAYDRFVEAARSDPGNAEAVWGLAESAHHLEMNDVAIRNYRLYLAALPNGPHAKEIRKALKDMGLDPGP